MNCCILGAGAWGTAMALHLDRCGHSVTLVPRRMEHALEIASSRENRDYLAGYKLPHSIQIGCEVGPVLMEAEVIFLACPSKALRALCQSIQPHLASAWQLKLCLIMCKGLELESLKTPAEIVAEELPSLACGVLSGPTFAGEVAAGKPTAVVLALGSDCSQAERYQTAFSNSGLRAYLSDDVRGTELGGTLKNIYAIGSGLCDGLRSATMPKPPSLPAASTKWSVSVHSSAARKRPSSASADLATSWPPAPAHGAATAPSVSASAKAKHPNRSSTAKSPSSKATAQSNASTGSAPPKN